MFTRRVLHYSPGPADYVADLSDRVAAGAWFELRRQGGCGDGELVLLDDGCTEGDIAVGDWIVFDDGGASRWYQGQVRGRVRVGSHAWRLTLAGMGRQLDDVFPGGFGTGVADGVGPHRYSQVDDFPDDPDAGDETVDAVTEPVDVVRLMVPQYVEPQTDITYDASLVETPVFLSTVMSLKIRGEESAAEILRDLAMRSRNVSWGVNADGKFFFLRPRSDLLATFQLGTDVVSMRRSSRKAMLFNRVLLTGGYIYGPPDDPFDPDGTPRPVHRWRGHYIQPESRDANGRHEIEIFLPWIRTQEDSIEFCREFFNVYADPRETFDIDVADQTTLLQPWDGCIRLLDANGGVLYDGSFETIRVQFDGSPRLHIHLGPPDPLAIWPRPLQPERTLIPAIPIAGSVISSSSNSSSSRA
jgi:hypothetical protein